MSFSPMGISMQDKVFQH